MRVGPTTPMVPLAPVPPKGAAITLASHISGRVFSRPIVTQVAKLGGFYAAEEYHQNYLAHHPNQLYIVINDKPKVEALKKQFPTIYTD